MEWSEDEDERGSGDEEGDLEGLAGGTLHSAASTDAGHSAGAEGAKVRDTSAEDCLPPELRSEVLGSPLEPQWSALIEQTLRRARGAQDQVPTFVAEVPVVGNASQEEADVPVPETTVRKNMHAWLRQQQPEQIPAVEVPAPPQAEVPAAEIPTAEVLDVEVPSIAELLAGVLAEEPPAAEVLAMEVPAVAGFSAPVQAEVPAAEVMAVELSPRQSPSADVSIVEEVPAMMIPAGGRLAVDALTLSEVSVDDEVPGPASLETPVEPATLLLTPCQQEAFTPALPAAKRQRL